MAVRGNEPYWRGQRCFRAAGQLAGNPSVCESPLVYKKVGERAAAGFPHSRVAFAGQVRSFGKVQLSWHRVNLELTHRWAIANAPATRTQSVVIVQLRDETGLVGWGEAAPSMRYGETVSAVEEFLARVEPARLSFADVEGSLQSLEQLGPAPAAARCALEMALWDGVARQARQPLYDYLGLGFEEGRYVSSFTIGIDAPDVVRAKVQSAAGHPVLKIKMGVPQEAEVLRAVREVAPRTPLRVDANEGWPSKEEALRKLEWLAEDPCIEFVEQPMPAERPLADWVWLKERSPLPILADESCRTEGDLTRCAECFHGVNVKLVKAGGLGVAKRMLQKARVWGLRTLLGCMVETSVGISAAAHLAGLCDFLDLDGNLLIRNDPFTGVTQERGRLTFARAPEPWGLRVAPRAGAAWPPPDPGR